MFQQKYSNMSNVDECLKICKDAIWTFNGKNKIEQQFDKLFDAQKTIQSKNPEDFKTSVNIVSKTKVIRDKYVVKYDICAGKTVSEIPAVLVKSELDSHALVSKKSIPAHTCKSFDIWIDSKYADKIDVKIVGSVNDISKSTKVKQI